MKLSPMIAGAALLCAANMVMTTASAAPPSLFENLKKATAGVTQVEKAAWGPCIWSRPRGWHQNGPFGKWRVCYPSGR